MNKTIPHGCSCYVNCGFDKYSASTGWQDRVGVLYRRLCDGLKEIGYDRRDDSAERNRESG